MESTSQGHSAEPICDPRSDGQGRVTITWMKLISDEDQTELHNQSLKVMHHKLHSSWSFQALCSLFREASRAQYTRIRERTESEVWKDWLSKQHDQLIRLQKDQYPQNLIL